MSTKGNLKKIEIKISLDPPSIYAWGRQDSPVLQDYWERYNISFWPQTKRHETSSVINDWNEETVTNTQQIRHFLLLKTHLLKQNRHVRVGISEFPCLFLLHSGKLFLSTPITPIQHKKVYLKHNNRWVTKKKTYQKQKQNILCITTAVIPATGSHYLSLLMLFGVTQHL